MKTLIKYLKSIKTDKFFIFLLATIVLGLMLRLLPDTHEIIWSYDQARDSFVMREMIANLDVKLIGPQTEIYGLFHGPLFYYLIGPFLYISKGEVGLAVLVMTLLTYSSIIPLSLLAYKITKNKLSILLTILIFSISYQFIEYARWISNVSVAIPFLAWTYFFYYQVLSKTDSKLNYYLLGISVGLASQGELFLLSLAGIIFLFLIANKKSIKQIFLYGVGGATGIFPLLVSELRFKFRGLSFIGDILLNPSVGSDLNVILNIYLEHIGLTIAQVVGGVNYLMAYSVLFVLALCFYKLFLSNLSSIKRNTLLTFILTILLSHLSLFFLSLVNNPFLDMEIAVLLILLLSLLITKLFERSKFTAYLVIGLIVILQFNNYKKFVIDNRPLDHFGFIQESSTLSHKEQILDRIYTYTDGRDFTFVSIGTPYGVRTVWASVFEIYSRNNSKRIPKWYGYHANGYPGEDILEIAQEPEKVHILLIESNIDTLLAKPIIDQEISNQNTHTKVVDEVVLYGNKIQFRDKL
ncbi:hypothetical protein JXA63_05165 [Candidatus Woesebacteria bacterium]|nr:hypothetical protein [Candidatus Woesebacteria bacterium]